MYPTLDSAAQPAIRRNPRAPICLLAAAVGLCVLATGTGGCSSDSSQQPAGTVGSYSASAFVTKEYGITQWHSLHGSNWLVVTGYRADGTAVRGVEMSWFASTSTGRGYTRLKMLDGSGAMLRRIVGGGQSGHLSTEQLAFVQAIRGDLKRQGAYLGRQSGNLSTVKGQAICSDLVRPVALLGEHDRSGVAYAATTNTNPSEGPVCLDAQLDPELAVDALGCGAGLATFETVIGGVAAVATCGKWYMDQRHANQICEQENQASCSGNPPTCNFGQSDPTQPTDSQPACDQECMCANYGSFNGIACTTCVTDYGCPAGQECHWGSCGPPAPNDDPTDENVSQHGQTSSCSGYASADPSNGDVSCSTSTASSPSDDVATDPYKDLPVCAGSGESCGASVICCIGDCLDGKCVSIFDDNLEVPACDKFAGDPCSSDSECCVGRCSGTCTFDEPDCKQDGDPCSTSEGCCNKKCDDTSGTCAPAIDA